MQPPDDWGPERPLLVGRVHEQERLHQLLAATLAGRGSVVLLGGEAGIGKTTLVEDLKRGATTSGVRVLSGHCYDLTMTPPYGPWRDVFRTVTLPDGPALLATMAATDRASGAVPGKEELFEQSHDQLSTMTVDQPLLIVLEDLHWSDPASLDLLRFLARRLADHPVLFVVTYRDTELTRHHPLFQMLPLLVREAGGERMTLRRLAADDVRELVAVRYRLPPADEDQLVTHLQAQAEGNPLFVGELLRTLEEEAFLTRESNGWVLHRLDHVPIPPLVVQVIEGRLARLADEERTLLQIAAVIGHVVPIDLWQSVAGASEEQLLAVIERGVDAYLLETTGDNATVRFVHALVREAVYGGALPAQRRRWHRRIAERVLHEQSPNPNIVAHHFQLAGDARMAEWLIRAGEGAERAYAWTTAAARFEAVLPLLEVDPNEQRLRGWVLLHLGRLLRFAMPEQAVAYLDEAMRVADAVDDRALAALARAQAGAVRCFRWDIKRGVAQVRSGIAAQHSLTLAEWVDAYRRQWALIDPLPTGLDLDDLRGIEIATITSQQTGFLVHLLAAVAAPSQEVVALGEAYAARIDAIDEQALLRHTSTVEGASWIDTWFGLGEAYAVAGRVDDAEQAFSRAVELYRAAGHHAVVLEVVTTHGWLVQIPYQADQRDARARWLATGVASEQRAEGAYSSGWLPGMMRLPLLVLEGFWSEAREVARNMIQHQPAPHVMLAEVVLVTIAHAQGDSETAWGIIDHRFPNGPDTDITDTIAYHAFDLARLAAALSLDSGGLTTAERWLATHDRWLDSIGRISGRAESQILRARAYALAGAWDRAREEAEEALALASAPRQPLALVAARRLLGEIATRQRDLEQAEHHLAASLTLADACGAPFERALTLLALAELRQATGKLDEERSLLDEVRSICVPLGAAPTLARIDAIQAMLDAESVTARHPAGLTAREVEVLRLVAQGLTDAEVAERLFLARRTINTHLTSIYTKLNVSSRAAATRFAVENGLA